MAILKKGSRGAKVKKLQEDLKFLEYDTGTPDGVFGRKTEDAVKKFQEDNSLVVDGKVGNNTSKKIEEKVEAKKASQPETQTDTVTMNDLAIEADPEDDSDNDILIISHNQLRRPRKLKNRISRE